MRFVLDGHATPEAAKNHAEGILRMLGIDRADASEIARRPMPPVQDPGGQPRWLRPPERTDRR
jgi:hypothetical protein